jgi:hypothetical protein
VIATDLPVTREVGGTAAIYVGLNDVRRWRDSVLELLVEKQDQDRAAARHMLCIENSTHFQWQRHAQSMANIYRDVCAVADQQPMRHSGDREAVLVS